MDFQIFYRQKILGEVADSVMISKFDKVKIISVRHTRNFKNALGGTRFVSAGTLDETFRLAKGMSEKCLACFVPVDGFKTLVITPRGIPDIKTRAYLLASHIRNVKAYDSTVIFGPDMGSPEEVMALTVDYMEGNCNQITGLPGHYGGLDIDKNGFTAYGLLMSLRSIKTKQSFHKVIIQGFGQVGSILAQFLYDSGYKIVGVSNIEGCLVNPEGIDIEKLTNMFASYGDDCFVRYANDFDSAFNKDKRQLFKQKADILVPAARTSSFGLESELSNLKDENSEIYSIEKLLLETGIHCVIEAANHPLTFSSEAYLEKKNVIVLPDFIVNC